MASGTSHSLGGRTGIVPVGMEVVNEGSVTVEPGVSPVIEGGGGGGGSDRSCFCAHVHD